MFSAAAHNGSVGPGSQSVSTFVSNDEQLKPSRCHEVRQPWIQAPWEKALNTLIEPYLEHHQPGTWPTLVVGEGAAEAH